MSIPSRKITRHRQKGIVLIEALVSILIFAVGVLAIVGLLAASVISSRDATNRAQAGMLANQIVGQMWADDRSWANLQSNYDTTVGSGCNTAGTNCKSWLSSVAAKLPGVAANPPTITVVGVPTASPTSAVVTITIYWKPPDAAAAAAPHKYVAVTQLNSTNSVF
jgi:type IV pilus assembly protein PilV